MPQLVRQPLGFTGSGVMLTTQRSSCSWDVVRITLRLGREVVGPTSPDQHLTVIQILLSCKMPIPEGRT